MAPDPVVVAFVGGAVYIAGALVLAGALPRRWPRPPAEGSLAAKYFNEALAARAGDCFQVRVPRELADELDDQVYAYGRWKGWASHLRSPGSTWFRPDPDHQTWLKRREF